MADFELAIDLNLRTILVTTEAAIPELRARGGGALLYTASTSGLVGSPFSPVDPMAKSASSASCGRCRSAWAPDKIRLNAICPGPIDTPMLRVFVPAPTSSRPGGRTSRRNVAARPAGPDAPHRETRGDRQRRALPPLGRSLVRLGRGPAGRRGGDGVSRRRFAVAALVPMRNRPGSDAGSRRSGGRYCRNALDLFSVIALGLPEIVCQLHAQPDRGTVAAQLAEPESQPPFRTADCGVSGAKCRETWRLR